MPKRIWHELPCGAMHRFSEHRYDDMTPVNYILQHFPPSEIKKLTNPKNVGGKRKQTAYRLNARIVKAFWKKAVDVMMEGDSIIIDKDNQLYIGTSGLRNDGRVVKYRKKRLNYLHSRKMYGIVLNGFFHNYNFRMPIKRRIELFERLRKGQSFL